MQPLGEKNFSSVSFSSIIDESDVERARRESNVSVGYTAEEMVVLAAITDSGNDSMSMGDGQILVFSASDDFIDKVNQKDILRERNRIVTRQTVSGLWNKIQRAKPQTIIPYDRVNPCEKDKFFPLTRTQYQYVLDLLQALVDLKEKEKTTYVRKESQEQGVTIPLLVRRASITISQPLYGILDTIFEKIPDTEMIKTNQSGESLKGWSLYETKENGILCALLPMRSIHLSMMLKNFLLDQGFLSRCKENKKMPTVHYVALRIPLAELQDEALMDARNKSAATVQMTLEEEFLKYNQGKSKYFKE